MARTIEEIQNTIIAEKETQAELNGLTSTSKVSVWRLFVYVIAYIIFTLELIFDKHQTEVNTAIADLKPHTARWYRVKALAFQYGFDLYPDTDIFNNENHTDEEIEESQIVKYSAVVESETETRLIIKIAGENSGELHPLDPAELEAFTAYIKEIRDAGVAITVINYLPDLLYLNLTIKRDPLVLDASGNAIAPVGGNLRPIDTTISNFLRNLPFNGELLLSSLTDALQSTAGVLDIQIDSAATAWISPESNDYGAAQSIYMSKIPESGYFTTEDPDGENLVIINYVV